MSTEADSPVGRERSSYIFIGEVIEVQHAGHHPK